eukprot:TRINITY_DN1205_c0_g2_i1.p1 TRINITY_DN1205_c0_g2~~TRINITY_DN1205_c0_g2_i1.p1  ORF type:complete len:329 (+),score=30.22 TRINITY_DN1205_c0_g2_i1:101-1087(+)
MKRRLSEPAEDGEPEPLQAVNSKWRKNAVRSTVMILDMSEGVNKRDLLPDRISNVTDNVMQFTEDYFRKCPLGRLAVVATREGGAETICGLEVSGVEVQKAIVSKVKGTCGSGVGSLLNALEVSMRILENQPKAAAKEVLVIWSSCSTADPGDIHETIGRVKDKGVVCNVIGLGGQLYVLGVLAKRTGGCYKVPRHENHFKELVMEGTSPALVSDSSPAYLIPMGFPTLSETPQGSQYTCPQCWQTTTSFPALCTICNTTLLSSAHIARSYYSLYDLPPSAPHTSDTEPCYGCSAPPVSSRCSACSCSYCSSCASFIKEKLNYCPGCN